MSNEALKPCDFCGSTQVSMSYSATMTSPEPHARFVECEDCCASGPAVDVAPMGDEAAQQRAVELWNTRSTDTPVCASTETVVRDISGETVCGFRVAAWRETHPEHGDKYGHAYSEHWSTPSTRDPRVKVERLFTEDQLRAALAASQAPETIERLREARNGGIREAAEWVASNMANNGTLASVAMLEELGVTDKLAALSSTLKRDAAK